MQSIDGIGEKTMEDLLKNFKSVKRIKEATLEELTTKVGLFKAQKIYKNLSYMYIKKLLLKE